MYKLFFEEDKRLDVKIEGSYKAYDVSDIFRFLRSKSKVGFFSADNEALSHQYSSGFSGISIRDYMDAIAAVYESGWEYDAKKGYELVSYDPNLSDPQYDTGGAMGRMKKVADDLMGSLGKLSPSVRDRLFGAGISGNDIPDSVYEGIAKNFQEEADRITKTLSPGYSVPDPKRIKRADVKIRLQPRSGQSKYKEYTLVYSSTIDGSPSGGGSISAVDRNSRKGFSEDGKICFFYHTKRFSYPKNQARKRPELKRLVSLNLGRVRLSEVAEALTKQHPQGVVTEVRRYLRDTKEVRIPPTPLARVLDRLEEIYPNTQWEMRESGVLVLRGPFNAARTRRDKA